MKIGVKEKAWKMDGIEEFWKRILLHKTGESFVHPISSYLTHPSAVLIHFWKSHHPSAEQTKTKFALTSRPHKIS
jgi:hypothetical protein